MQENTTAIWAPHPDDEIIGCSLVLNQNCRVCYYSVNGDIDDLNAIEKVVNWYGCETYFIYSDDDYIGVKWRTVYAPDPAVDMHPIHQKLGHMAQDLFRRGQIERLMLYTTSMNAPYIFEVKDPQAKLAALNHCYPHKADLWKYDHRYWLFEGYHEWHRPGS